MKTTLFYFSGTGNSLQVARDLAKELINAEITAIAKVIGKNPDFSADRIGIIFPVYMFGMPLIVKKFVEELKVDKNKYIFAIATCGGKAGNTLRQADQLLKAHGLSLAAGFIIRMPGNYTPLYGALPKKKQDKLFAKELSRIKEIVQIVKNNNQYKIEGDAFLVRGIFSALYKKMSAMIPLLDKDFWADEKCIHCGTCVKICPVKNVKLVNRVPVWLHKCEQCFACLQWCPVEAIQYGKNTAKRKRYHNPTVKWEELQV
ncbi:MAG: EFR1 family ferrodoxin [Candidatus Omnitrophica bacterium]|nr:EFR1 family ferrodoxin [Candidatus Omnitrophota bacterium]